MLRARHPALRGRDPDPHEIVNGRGSRGSSARDSRSRSDCAPEEVKQELGGYLLAHTRSAARVHVEGGR
jgi:hypothetical protein